MSYATKFCWSIIHTKLSPHKRTYFFTWDSAVMLTILIARLEIDFSKILIAEIHETDFRKTTTVPFPYLFFAFEERPLCHYGTRIITLR